MTVKLLQSLNDSRLYEIFIYFVHLNKFDNLDLKNQKPFSIEEKDFGTSIENYLYFSPYKLCNINATSKIILCISFNKICSRASLI